LTPKAAARLGHLVAGQQEPRESCREACPFTPRRPRRLPILEELYSRIFAETGVPNRVLDLACGLHPFGLPWMGLPETATYHARTLIAS